MMKKAAIAILVPIILGLFTTLYGFGKSIASLEKDTINNSKRIERNEKKDALILDKIDQIKTDVLNQQKNMYDNFLRLYQRK